MKKRILAALMVLTLACTMMLAGCDKEESSNGSDSGSESSGSSEKKNAEDIKVAAVFKTLNSEYWGNVRDGAQAAADDLGIDITILGANDETQIAEQVTILEEQLSSGIDALVVAPIEESAVIGALEGSVNDLPIVFVDSDADLEGKAAFVGTGNVTAAKLGGEYIAGKLEKGDKVVLIGGQQGESTSSERLQGYEEALEAAGIEILETQYGKNVADQGMAVMEDLLTKYPGEIDAVLSMNDDMALGCLQAIEASGEKDILILGFDGNAAALEAIDKGEYTATVAQQPYDMGYQAVEQAYKAAMGEKIEEVQEVNVILVDKDNVKEYLK